MNDLRKRAEIVKLAQQVSKSLKAQPLIDYFEQSPETGQVDAIVMRTGYLCELGETRTFVVADNISGAMDCLERISNGEDYKMIIHHSIPIVLDA